ncbi:hypothetical protein Avbf_16390 [Armadillidium vulgare]|nr:hypothetical protein Avbf_16390 [Armadillidium vulgare]
MERLMVPLPGYDCHGRKVILSRLGAWTPYKHRPEDLFRAASMLFDALFIEDEQMSVTGFVQVNDMTGISFRHASCLSLSLVRKVMSVWTVNDMTGISFRHASCLSLSLVRKVMSVWTVNDMTGISFRHASCLSLSLVRKVMSVWTVSFI